MIALRCKTPNCTGPLARVNRTKKPQYEGYCTVCRMQLQQRQAKANKLARQRASAGAQPEGPRS